MMATRGRWVTAAVTLALLAGCHPEAEIEVTASAEERDVTASDADGSSVGSRLSPARDDRDPPDADPWPDPIPVATSGEHPDGVTVEVSEVRSTSAVVELDVRIVNEQDVAVELNGGATTMVVEDTGIEHLLVPPSGDEPLVVDAGQVLQGRLVFDGPLTAEATELTLAFNPGLDDGSPPTDRPAPSFVVEGLTLLDGS